jgi:hypothetical protein
MSQPSGFRRDQIGAYIEKDPDARLDYTVDWSDWLLTNDDIATSTWTVSTIAGDASPLDNYSNLVTQGKTTVYLQNGTPGKNYTVTVRITTTAGLRDERNFRVFVKNRTL